MTSAVVKRLAHELDVIERAGLAEFFLICWDLMRFAKERGIPAQGRGSATSSIVSYTLGISRVEPIAHNLLFERFINPGRTTYPDVDIDFSSERREEVIQYVYRRYGPEHTGMVCNLVTYRARSAVREVGYALGFPRPLVDRVAKALETYDSVMVRRDLEADGGFAEFFKRTGEGLPAEALAAREAEARGLVDGMGQLQQRVPLVGKVPPWRQPPKPEDPDAPRPFAWLGEGDGGARAAGGRGCWRGRRESLPAVVGHGGRLAADPARSARVRYARRFRSHRYFRGYGPRKAVRAVGRDGSGRESRSDRARSGRSRRGRRPFRASYPRFVRWERIADRGATPGRDAAERHGVADPDPLAPRTAIRGGGTSDDEGGPGDTPASVAWLRAGRGTGYAADQDRLVPAAPDAVAVDPEHGQPLPPAAQDRPPGPAQHVGPTADAARTRAPSLAWNPSRHRRPAAVPRSGSPTGSAGWSSAPASMASRGTSPSTAAGCS